MAKAYADIYQQVMAKIGEINIDVAQSRASIVDEEGIFRLLHFDSLTGRKYRTPILIVYAWINRPYVLDLQPEISIIQKYLRTGFDVYMIDWGYPTAADQYLTLDDYTDYLDKSVDFIKEQNKVSSVNLHGYCLGGTLSAAYAAIRPQNIKNLLLQAAPIDFNTDNSIALWASSLDVNKITETYQMAPGEMLNLGFLLADPINLIIGKYEGFLDMIDSDPGMASFLRMDYWIFDSPAIPGETYRQYINDWYHQNKLIKGEFKVLGEKVELGNITTPTLVLSAKHDHIAPPAAQKAILNIISSTDKDVYEIAKGHIGISTSRESHREYWPKVIMWLEKRSEPVESVTGRVRQPHGLKRIHKVPVPVDADVVPGNSTYRKNGIRAA